LAALLPLLQLLVVLWMLLLLLVLRWVLWVPLWVLRLIVYPTCHFRDETVYLLEAKGEIFLRSGDLVSQTTVLHHLSEDR
jgi:hypothetical protein